LIETRIDLIEFIRVPLNLAILCIFNTLLVEIRIEFIEFI